MSLSSPSPSPRNPPPSLRVGVVEDDEASRDSLAALLAQQPDLELVLCASGRGEALALLPTQPLDVLLVDLGLPDGSGLDVIRAARRQWPDCGVLVSTVFGDESHVLRSIEAGAMGYLLKDSDAGELVEQIRSLHAGGSPISPMVARKILARAAAQLAPDSGPMALDGPPSTPVDAPDAAIDEAIAQQSHAVALSTREQQVLRLVSKGFTADETAQALNVSRSTVLTFVRRIYAKLQVGTRAEAIHEAHRQGLLDQ